MRLEKRGCENYFAQGLVIQGLPVQVLPVQVLPVQVSPVLIHARRDTVRPDPAQ